MVCAYVYSWPSLKGRGSGGRGGGVRAAAKQEQVRSSDVHT